MSFPLNSLIVSGQWKHEVVYQKNGRVRAYVVPVNPRTALQQIGRMRFSDLIKEFLDVGQSLRDVFYLLLGPHWRAVIIGYLLDRSAANWSRFFDAFDGFTDQEQADWESFDGGLDLANRSGAVFFAVTSACYEVCLQRDDILIYDQPGGDNSAEIAAVWPREAVVFKTGQILEFGGPTMPYGWLLCDGSSLARVDYPDLFDVLGTTWGAVDGDHFNLPDMHEGTALGAWQARVEETGGDITYSGTWSVVVNSYSSGGQYKRTNIITAYAEIAFVGDKFRLYYSQVSPGAECSLLLDGNSYALINMAGSTTYQRLYESGDFEEGPHVLKLLKTVDDGNYISIDAFEARRRVRGFFGIKI
jgi:hypothetical protein